MVKIKIEQIKKVMSKNSYTMKQFCEFTGVSKKEMNKILEGELNFKFISLVKLARFFDVPVDWLLDFGITEVQTKFYL